MYHFIILYIEDAYEKYTVPTYKKGEQLHMVDQEKGVSIKTSQRQILCLHDTIWVKIQHQFCLSENRIYSQL